MLDQLANGERDCTENPMVDIDPEQHRLAYRHWFHSAGIDDELATALHAVESAPELNALADDAAPAVSALSEAGVRIAVVSLPVAHSQATRFRRRPIEARPHTTP